MGQSLRDVYRRPARVRHDGRVRAEPERATIAVLARRERNRGRGGVRGHDRRRRPLVSSKRERTEPDDARRCRRGARRDHGFLSVAGDVDLRRVRLASGNVHGRRGARGDRHLVRCFPAIGAAEPACDDAEAVRRRAAGRPAALGLHVFCTPVSSWPSASSSRGLPVYAADVFIDRGFSTSRAVLQRRPPRRRDVFAARARSRMSIGWPRIGPSARRGRVANDSRDFVAVVRARAPRHFVARNDERVVARDHRVSHRRRDQLVLTGNRVDRRHIRSAAHRVHRLVRQHGRAVGWRDGPRAERLCGHLAERAGWKLACGVSRHLVVGHGRRRNHDDDWRASSVALRSATRSHRVDEIRDPRRL